MSVSLRYRVVARLIRKDCYLHRWLSVGSMGAGIVALGLVASGGAARFYMGCVLLVTVLIALGATLTILSVVEERQEQTLPFIMSLPVSVQQYAAAKILANLLIFGATWSVLLLGALSLILISDKLPNGLVVYALILSGEILLSTCAILAVAMITRSLPWTIGTMIFGNLVFNGVVFQLFRSPTFIAAAESPSVVWPLEALSLLFAELACIALLLTIAYAISTRRKDVL